MDFMVVVPSTTPKGKVSGMTVFDEQGESRFIEVNSEATREEWLQVRTAQGFAVVGEALVVATVLHTMGITLDEQENTCATLPLQGGKLATIPLKGGEVRIHS